MPMGFVEETGWKALRGSTAVTLVSGGGSALIKGVAEAHRFPMTSGNLLLKIDHSEFQAFQFYRQIHHQQQNGRWRAISYWKVPIWTVWSSQTFSLGFCLWIESFKTHKRQWRRLTRQLRTSLGQNHHSPWHPQVRRRRFRIHHGVFDQKSNVDFGG